MNRLAGWTVSRVDVVDDEPDVRAALAMLLRSVGMSVREFPGPREWLAQAEPERAGCLVLDVRMPGMSGLEMQQAMKQRGLNTPIVFISGHGDIPMAVRAVHEGAVDFLEKPFDDEQLLASVRDGLARAAHQQTRDSRRADIAARLTQLTPREREIMDLLLNGSVNKIIARRLDLSVRTVEIHRARVLAKMDVANATQLIRELVGAGLLDQSSLTGSSQESGSSGS